MNTTRLALIALIFAGTCGAASAQSNTNAQRCQELGNDVQASFQKALQARMPQTDPTSFNQETFDVKGILSQDVSSGFGKLLSMNFSGLIDSIVKKGLSAATQKANSTFTQRMNGILNSVGVSSVNFNISKSGVSVAAPSMESVVTGVGNSAATAAGDAAKRSISVYSR